MKLLPFFALPCALILLSGQAQSDPLPVSISLDSWKTGLPFYFKYDGKPSTDILASWQKSEEPATPSEGGETHHYVFTEPATKLKVTIDVRTFTDFEAIDWLIHFTNEGTTDSAIIEDVQPLQCIFTCKNQTPVIHGNVGSVAQTIDFSPKDKPLDPGVSLNLVSVSTSSENSLPYFNLQDGDHGIVGAIGWTGSWHADFARDKTAPTVTASAGMLKTHFRLHPGESVRMPRIVLLNWKGDDWLASQNVWRRFVLAHYSPRDPSGKVVKVPLCFGTWGTELISAKLAMIKQLHDKQIPIDVYWVDAGWYGTLAPTPGASPNEWMSQLGDWTPSPACYPDGLKPLGNALKADGYGFLLWMAAENAVPGSAIVTQHPDWFARIDPNGGPNLNLGNPDARKGITDIVSRIIHDNGVTMFREDFTYDLRKLWDTLDTPDRVGISEINYVTGFYQFWDDLRAQNPGLQIDNCAGGARRMDIEAMSRSVVLWRSDALVNNSDPILLQTETQGLNSWVPLNAGLFPNLGEGTPNNVVGTIYAARSGYSAGYTYGIDRLSIDYLKTIGDEFREVRPYFYGDFYPLTPYHVIYDPKQVTAFMVAWQLDRPDLKSGVVQVFRRQKCTDTSITLALHAIDPQAKYDVEIRPGLKKEASAQMPGQELAGLKVAIPDQPGSALIFYRKE